MNALARGLVGLVVVTSAIAAVEPGDDRVPGFGPRTMSAPLLPEASSLPVLTGDAGLVDRLQERMGQLQVAIDRLLAETGGDLPDLDARRIQGLEEPRRQRDIAWRDLERALRDAGRSERGPAGDVLDQPAAAAADPVESRLRAENRLATANIYHELLASGGGTDEDLAAARSALEAIDVDDLPTIHHPRLHYLRFSLALAGAERATSGEDRLALENLASRHLATLKAAHPGSVLVGSAGRLLESYRAEAARRAASASESEQP